MKTSSRYVLQIGLAITFVTIGFMILKDPLAWGSFISTWAAKLIPGSIESAMVSTAYLDIIIGILFLFGPTIWIAAFLGTVHLAIVLVTTGIESASVTIRDVGLIAATIVLMIETTPASVVRKVFFWRK